MGLFGVSPAIKKNTRVSNWERPSAPSSTWGRCVMKLLCFPARWQHTCRLAQPWSWNSRCESCQQMWQRFTFSLKVTCVQELLKTDPAQSWSGSGHTVPSTTKCRLLWTLHSAGCRQQGSYASLGHVWIVCLVIMRNPFSSFIGTFHIWVTQQVATGPFPPRNRSENPLNRRMSDRVRAPPCLLCVTPVNEGPSSSEAARRSEVSCVDPKTSPVLVCKSVWSTSFKPSQNIHPKSLRE